jgi:hypothetical protein
MKLIISFLVTLILAIQFINNNSFATTDSIARYNFVYVGNIQ